MSKRIALVTSALMLAIGAAGASAATDTTKKAHPADYPRSQASLQCSADANAKGLHGKERVAFRHDCLRKAMAHNANYHKPAVKKHAQPASTHQNANKPDKKA